LAAESGGDEIEEMEEDEPSVAAAIPQQKSPTTKVSCRPDSIDCV